MYPCLWLKVLAEYNLQLCACSKRDSCVPVFLYTFLGDTRPGLHLNVVAELRFTQVKVTGASPVYFALVKRTGRSSSLGFDPRTDAMASHSAASFEHGEGEEDLLQQGNESYATNHRHLQELTPSLGIPAGNHKSTAII